MSVSEKIIEHKTFGKVMMIKSTRTRRISISAKPFQPLRLTLPVFESFSRAERFLEEKEKWIQKTLEKIRKLEGQYTIFKEDTNFQTHEHELNIERIDGDIPKVSLKDKQILVQLPETSDIRSPEIQDMIRWGILASWRKEAKKYLPVRLNELSRKHQLPYNRVIIKNNKSRWGSCSQKDNINLSLHLMRLPDHLIDYILLHELAHTLHKNHGRQFWKSMEKICPNAKSLDKEMRGYRIEIY
ncbi:MAG: M48 family metallopeptidase [Bacteroidales bacterium]|nr:M48 family metallopeptidase [Bacteroidales bacterium]